MTLDTGTVIGGYRVESVLGHGSMGTVYSALDVALDRRIALKVLIPELARDQRFRQRFLRESRLAAGLEHPHIVPIHAAGEDSGVVFLAMRYVDGRDLSSLLQNLTRLDPERALAILGPIAAALDVAHARGLVHRDVKPANILLARHSGSAEYPYLCDFGLAKHASTVSSLTGDRAIVGTVEYLAPEQIEGGPVDGRVDVYALGCVLYEAVVGEAPFHRDNELASVLAHVRDPTPKPSERRSELPVELDAVIERALAKRPEERFDTATELIEAARAAFAGKAIAPGVREPAAAAVRTFVFADVRGYTAYTREHGDEAGAALAARFADLVRDRAPSHRGHLQELRGDEALVVFDSAREALRFAVDLRARVEGDDGLERPVGIGLDTGEAVPVEGGFRGGALNRAARLCSLAKPGEVLASDAVTELAGKASGIAYGFHRTERLKGFDKPVGVVEVHAADTAPGRELGRRLKQVAGGSRPRRRLSGVLVLVAAVAIALATFFGLVGGGSDALAVDTVGVLDPTTMANTGSVTGLGETQWLAADSAGTVWSFDQEARSLTGVDARTRKVVARFPSPVNACDLVTAENALWVSDCDGAQVVRLDPKYGTVVGRVRLPHAKGGDIGPTYIMAYGAGSIWVAFDDWPFRVARIDPRTARILKIFDLEHADGEGRIAFGDGSLWVADNVSGHLARIDPRTNTVAATGKLHGGSVEDIRAVGGYAWAAIHDDGGVWKVDSQGNVLRLVSTGELPFDLSDDGKSLFVVNSNSDVSRVDPATDEVATTQLGHRPASLAVAGGDVWVAVKESADDARAGLDPESTLTIAMSQDYYFLTDPVLASFANIWQLQYAIGARLLRAPDLSEPKGATLFPEIASLPTVSNGGRTYTFRIRPGYAFSPPSNAPVTAAVMRYSIERAISPRIVDDAAVGWRFMSDVEGFQRYRDGKTAHVSGIRLDGDTLSFTLVKPAPDFPARISLPPFSAVPLGTPALVHGVDTPLPSAGPSYVSSHIPDSQVVLRRNPNYDGPRSEGPDAIVAGEGVAPAVGAERVAANAADYTFAVEHPYPVALTLNGSLDRRFGEQSQAAKAAGQRFFIPVSSGVRMLDFNSKSGVFRDARLRRAVSYALDRPALAAVTDSVPSADPVPPGVPGSGARIDYPLGGPDLARAQALAGPGRRAAVSIVPPADRAPEVVELVAIVKRDLARIGIDVHTRTFGDPWAEASKPGSQWNLLLDQWAGDYADPSDFVNTLFDPGALSYAWAPLVTYARYGDPHFVARMRAAYRTMGRSRAGAYRTLVSDMMRTSPPAAVFGHTRSSPQLFSDRVGCQVFRPQDAGWVDLAALCLEH